MQYFSFISHTYSQKNKLERSVAEFLEQHNRKIIPKQQLKEFKKEILGGISFCNTRNQRCKPIKPSWTLVDVDPHDKDRDITLQLGSGTICHFHLYATKI